MFVGVSCASVLCPVCVVDIEIQLPLTGNTSNSAGSSSSSSCSPNVAAGSGSGSHNSSSSRSSAGGVSSVDMSGATPCGIITCVYFNCSLCVASADDVSFVCVVDA